MMVRVSLVALACAALVPAGCATKPSGPPATSAEPRKPESAETPRPEPVAKGRAQAPACSAPPVCGQPAATQAPAAAKLPADAEALVRQLGDADYERREAAQKALAAMGAKALPAIERGAAGGDFEIAARCEKLIEGAKAAPEPEPPEIPEDLRAAFRQNWGSVWRGGHGPGSEGPPIRIQGDGIELISMRRTGSDSRSFGAPSGRMTVSVDSAGVIAITIELKGQPARTHTYRAGSRQEFERKYPRFAEKYLR